MMRWTLTIATVLLLGVWVGAMRVKVVWFFPPTPSQVCIGVARGALVWGRDDWSGGPVTRGLHCIPNSPIEGPLGFDAVWWVDWDLTKGASGKVSGFVAVPLWIPALFTLGGSLAAWRHSRRRRIERGQCLACGYDLRGLPADEEGGKPTCPECGA